MKNKSLVAAFLIVGAVIAVTSFAASPQQTSRTTQSVQRPATQTWQYAELTYEGDDKIIWSPSGTNEIPQIRTIRDQYSRFGGRHRATFVNLLGEIGADRWELITVDESMWTFKRIQ